MILCDTVASAFLKRKDILSQLNCLSFIVDNVEMVTMVKRQEKKRRSKEIFTSVYCFYWTNVRRLIDLYLIGL